MQIHILSASRPNKCNTICINYAEKHTRPSLERLLVFYVQFEKIYHWQRDGIKGFWLGLFSIFSMVSPWKMQYQDLQLHLLKVIFLMQGDMWYPNYFGDVHVVLILQSTQSFVVSDPRIFPLQKCPRFLLSSCGSVGHDLNFGLVGFRNDKICQIQVFLISSDPRRFWYSSNLQLPWKPEGLPAPEQLGSRDDKSVIIGLLVSRPQCMPFNHLAERACDSLPFLGDTTCI